MKKGYWLIGIWLLISCGSQKVSGNKEIEGIETYTFNKDKLIQALPAERFNRVLDSLNPIVIDVREPEKYSKKRIKNAKNLNYESLNFALEISRLNKNAKYAIYCDNGIRSRLAIQKFIDADIKTVFVLKGGIEVFEKKFPQKIESGSD
ncbi:MAG: rhodanese-like domain-containing protein [Bacteroidia bacterium]|nr:rhodanese-like domain-containing protein [Bacteroidia bacterium]MDW8301532.1 rhodanese-like domain-containing protein [Bacteroidia bacterium]